MSEGFAAGVLYGEHLAQRDREKRRIKPGLLESVRAQNEENRRRAAGYENLSRALMDALHDVAPEHPLVNPMAAGKNLERNRVFEEGVKRAEREPGK